MGNMKYRKLEELLFIYKENYPDELEMTERFIDFVDGYSTCFDRTEKYGHITGSAWVLDNTKTKILLTHHKKLNKWLQLGGHSDGNPDTLSVAIREVKEESSIEDFYPYTEDIFDLDAHLIPARKSEPEHYHFDVRFLLICNGSEEYVVSDESHDLAWVKLSEIERYTKEEAVLRLVRKSLKLFHT